MNIPGTLNADASTTVRNGFAEVITTLTQGSNPATVAAGEALIKTIREKAGTAITTAQASTETAAPAAATQTKGDVDGTRSTDTTAQVTEIADEIGSTGTDGTAEESETSAPTIAEQLAQESNEERWRALKLAIKSHNDDDSETTTNFLQALIECQDFTIPENVPYPELKEVIQVLLEMNSANSKAIVNNFLVDQTSDTVFAEAASLLIAGVDSKQQNFSKLTEKLGELLNLDFSKAQDMQEKADIVQIIGLDANKILQAVYTALKNTYLISQTTA